MNKDQMFYFGVGSLSLIASIALFGINLGSFNIAAKVIGTFTSFAAIMSWIKFFQLKN